MHPKPPIHILQFGTGNFLRAFFEPMVQRLSENHNNLNICIIQSTSGKTLEKLKTQDYQYHVLEAGIKSSEKIQKLEEITCIKDGLSLPEEQEKFLEFAAQLQVQWIISNVTEAGMVWLEEGPFEKFAESFAGRITQWLYRRFNLLPEASTVILPCELLPNNGDLLKSFVLAHAKKWELIPEFISWLEQKVTFFNNLVDRIVPGFPAHLDLKEKESDPLLVQTEPYSFWAIQGSPAQASLLPFLDADTEVILEEDISQYSLRKIRILNGCHTYMASVGPGLGYATVLEFISDPTHEAILHQLVDQEIIPDLPMDREALLTYKNQVFDRFRNPFVAHKLADIQLNSIAKFKSRLLPLLDISHPQKPIIASGMLGLLKFYLENPEKVRDTEDTKKQLAAVTQSSLAEQIRFASQSIFGVAWNDLLEELLKKM